MTLPSDRQEARKFIDIVHHCKECMSEPVMCVMHSAEFGLKSELWKTVYREEYKIFLELKA